ncbi:MAG: family 20 glycosylhydrolase [Bacteroidota bacterium]
MKTLNFSLLLFISLFTYACTSTKVERPKVKLVPWPNQLSETEGNFVITPKTTISANSDNAKEIAKLFIDLINDKLSDSFSLKVEKDTLAHDIHFELDPSLDFQKEEYQLSISPQAIVLKAATQNGLFYGYNTLLQLLPVNKSETLALPALEIIDAPRFAWRGLHLDVSRHFFSLSYIKKYIDYLALHKMNVFHWHLVDGIGWRIEIKSHPELTNIGAWRKVKEDKQPWEDFEVWREGDSEEKYGGFYTQEEIKEVVAYAKERFITVVPEIELPGHSHVVFQCYPDLLCEDNDGNKITGSDVYCASNPKSYQFLEDIFNEVLELFPSEYIHIGGDEVGKTTWKTCVHCQKMMKEQNYTPEELQSHFVNHFDNYLKEKGRKLIGWHEITEGNLSKSATIMYWGGEKGVFKYLEKGHPMVLSPGNVLYFDHYQSLSEFEPRAFGGYSSLTKIYNYNPVQDSISTQLADNVLGIQANTWTEYLPTEAMVDYRVVPRMAALAEIAWTKTAKKDFNRFQHNVANLMKRYETMGINYSKSAYRPFLHFELDSVTRNVNVQISTELPAKIYYTLDGSDPNSKDSKLYSNQLSISNNLTIKAISVVNGETMTETESHEIELHKARGAEVNLLSEPYGKYSAKGGYTLVDLDFGGDKWGNGKWLGILNNDLEAIVKLPESTEIEKIALNCIENTGSGIHFPVKFEFWVSSDGENYKSIGIIENKTDEEVKFTSDIKLKRFELNFDKLNTQYIKVKADCIKLPKHGAFIFTDELIVN